MNYISALNILTYIIYNTKYEAETFLPTHEHRKYCCTLQNLSVPLPGLPNFVISLTRFTAVRNTITDYTNDAKTLKMI